MKQTDYPSFDDIISLIPQEIEHNGKLSCLNPNLDSNFKGKKFYRLSTHNSKKDIHLTFGEDLAKNFDKQTLFKDFLKFNPKNPSWLNRDRFVLSAGHGSMLLYSLLYLTGYKSIRTRSYFQVWN